MDNPKLYSFQNSAIEALKNGNIHLALTAPTGSGKGFILEYLAKDPCERILILTPLLALARQQSLRFENAGIFKNQIKILCPEAAMLRKREIKKWSPTLIAVDEAHCIYEWGENFRPAYQQVLGLINELSCKRTLWMSATFPKTLIEDMKEVLRGSIQTQGHFQWPTFLKMNFIQIPPNERLEKVQNSFASSDGAGLVFVGTRNNVHRYLKILKNTKPALPYHAGLSDEERKIIERRISKNGDTHSIIATSAFGMGMDFPQFKWVILTQAPYTIISLAQSFGRVARNRSFGRAELFWSEEDFRFLNLVQKSNGLKKVFDSSLLRRYLCGSICERTEIENNFFL